MKRIVAIIALLLVACCSSDKGKMDVERLESVPMPKFVEPSVESGTLQNGLKYYLIEDKQLPVIQLNVVTKTGGIYEPADKLGLARLLGISMRTGGTKDLTPEDVDRAFDNMAAEAGIALGLEMGEATIKILSKDSDKALSIFFDLLFRPRLDPKRVELGKIKIIEALKREDDYPEQVVGREFKKLVYGDKSPWARRPTPESLKALTIDDLRKFHGNYFVPSNMIVAAAGDFDKAAFIEHLKRLTANAPDRKVELPAVVPVELKFPSQERRIARPVTQSYIEVGHLGIKRHNPDKYALEIMDTILGAPVFKSRLMEDIRSNRGLAYTVASNFGWGTDYGLFDIYVDTKAQTEKQVVDLIREHVARMKEKGDVTEAELNFAKKSVLNRLIFEFDNSFKIVTSRARYHFYGYPDNYWHIYRDSIEKVTLGDVKRVSREYLHPEGLSIAIVGPK